MRIVLDTNFAFSALLWRGAMHELLTHLRSHPTAQLFSSPVLLEELTGVLTRPTATRQLAVIGKTARDVLADYLTIVELVEPQPLPAPVSRDPDDDHVLACALAANAALIVTGDRDLLDLGSFRQIRILTAQEALAALASRP
ncbi:MAG: putative toxin-antitoxin system toxin component, PIN family [Proteobacteria bacterium]|nr:putative toxin-antitoxin system toxin component, PIN family [Pseudomonadota bacterium]